jgi:hypothetical protein
MRRVLAVGAALLLAGCTSTVSGQGSGPPASPSPTPTTPGTPTTTAKSTTAPAGIGDPGAADLCQPVQAASLGASFDDPQYAGSCSLTVSRGGVPRLGLAVTAVQPAQARPRSLGTAQTVGGLPVVAFQADQFSCERDIWLTRVVLAVSADTFGSTVTNQAMCSAADRLTLQEARALSASTLAERPLARPTLVALDMCRGVTARDLQGAPGGGVLTIERSAYGFKCHATNLTYSLGVQVVFHRTEVKALGSTTVRSHRLVWFDSEGIGSVCQVVSIQKPTTNAAIVEGVGMYLITKTGRPTGQGLCNLLTGEAARVLDRLGLS